jgi:signal transduction histidine kinase
VLFVSAHRPHAFSAETTESLKGLAALAAVAIENGYLLERHRAAEARLADALRVREQFASAAAHELKAPLTPLKGYAQAIRRRMERAQATAAAGPGSGSQDASPGAPAPVSGPLDAVWLARALDIMLGQIDRMDRLVTDLLDVSRLRAGQFTIEPEPADFVVLAREAFERVRESAGAQQEALEPELAHQLRLRSGAASLPGIWDRNRIDQLLTNLLTNAIKYSPNGGTVQLVVEPAATVASAEIVRQAHSVQHAVKTPQDVSGWVYLAVRDEGIGLTGDRAAHARLFDPFIRGENALSDRFSGFGLGLYICAEVVRRHGGTIWADSAGPNRGSTFHVLLPPHPPS